MTEGASPLLTESSRFADGKEAGALRTIGEVADALGIRQHVLRYWEEQFPTLRPLKRSGSRRYYRPEDVALVETIDRLVHHEGYTLRGARLVVEGKAAPSPSAPRAVVTPVTAEPMPVEGSLLLRLHAIRATLAAALDA